MSLTYKTLTNTRISYALLVVIVVFGFSMYNLLSRNSMPPYTVRVAAIVTAFPGAGPERVEMLVTDKIEKVAQELAEVETITSESRTGLSIVNVTLRDDVKNLREVWDKLRRKIETISGDLPSGIIGPDVKDEDLGEVFGIMLGLESDGFTNVEMEYYAEQIRDELIKLPDAAKVEIGGLLEQQVFVEYNDAQLAEMGITGGQLQNIISSTNIIFPGGDVILQDQRIIIEPTGNFEELADLKNLLISIGKKGETIPLGEVTTIYTGYKSPAEQIVRINGKTGLSISVSLIEGANIINLGNTINEKIERFNLLLPHGLTLSRISSQDYDVQKSIKDFMINLLQAVIIVLLTMLVFLGLRTGLVVASLIPMAIITTLLLMGLLDVGLNQVSLAALIMALGMLVDNAIVMAESIMVKMERGIKAFDAAVESSKELFVPLLISSLTTSAAFLAFFLAESVLGEIIGELFVVITIALLSSWIMALTLIPLLAIAFIKVSKVKEQKETLFDKLQIGYNKLLLVSLKRPVWFLSATLLLFIGSLFCFQFLPFIFFPDSERNLITLDITLPLGTRIEKTAAVIEEIEGYIRKDLQVNEERERGILDWSSFAGKGPESYDLGYFPDEANSGYAHMLINTSSGDDNDFVIEKLDRYCFLNLPEAEVKVKKLAGGGGSGVPVSVRISGKDPTILYGIVEDIKAKLYAINGTKNIGDDWGDRIKKAVVRINQDNARQVGITNQDIAVSLRTNFSGFETGEFRKGDKSLPIIMRNKKNEDLSYSDLESMTVYSQNSGQSVPLSQVASIIPQWQYAKIKRRDLYKTITVNSYLQTDITATDVTSVLKPWLEQYASAWPMGYTFELGGEAESSADNMNAVIEKLPISFFIILLLLILQFNSYRKTLIVLLTIPLGVIGVIFGLLIANSFFSFFAFLGIISLAGIVINNAIVLMDRIQIEKEEKQRNDQDSIVFAANERFRPIILTTCTTVFGLIPLWLGGGLMWEPMAISIIFGLLFATMITLLFVPIVYRLFFKISFK